MLKSFENLIFEKKKPRKNEEKIAEKVIITLEGRFFSVRTQHQLGLTGKVTGSRGFFVIRLSHLLIL
jgi:hypothetical protein